MNHCNTQDPKYNLLHLTDVKYNKAYNCENNVCATVIKIKHFYGCTMISKYIPTMHMIIHIVIMNVAMVYSFSVPT